MSLGLSSKFCNYNPRLGAWQTMSLKGKLAIVTGASKGIGSAIALSLAREGCSIALAYTSPSSIGSAKEIQNLIANYNNGAKTILVCSDLANPSCGFDIVQQTLCGFNIFEDGSSRRTIDILIHNAAFWLPGNEVDFSCDFSCDNFEKVMNINVRSAALLVEACVPYMPANGSGKIISIAAYIASQHITGQDIYLASKAALEATTKCWAYTYGQSKGITANSIALGYIPTSSNSGKQVSDDGKISPRQSFRDNQVCQNGPDVAEMVVWLAKSGSKWISGDVLQCIGGYVGA